MPRTQHNKWTETRVHLAEARRVAGKYLDHAWPLSEASNTPSKFDELLDQIK